MISLILYLSTTVFFSISLLVLVIPLVLIRYYLFLDEKKYFSEKEFVGYCVIGLSACFLLVLNVLHGPVISNVNEGSLLGDIPYIVFLPLAFLLGKYLKFRDLRIIQVLIIFEIIVGVVEYLAGVPTFFRNNTGVGELGDSGILYQSRVFGFSPNSSTLAAKIIYLATISIVVYKNKNKVGLFDKLVVLFVLIGLFVTFNRTAIIAVFLSILVLFGFKLKNMMLLTFPLIAVVIFKWDAISEQLTRGRGTVDVSGRDQIFNYFYTFWTDNPLFGNFGTKLWWNSSGSIWHSHNSYLEFLASNGIIASLFLLIGWVLIFGRKTIIILPILVFSVFQYGFLWGLSFYDVVMSAIIYSYVANVKTNSGYLTK